MTSPRTTLMGVLGFVSYLCAAAANYTGGPAWLPGVAALLGAAFHTWGLILAADGNRAVVPAPASSAAKTMVTGALCFSLALLSACYATACVNGKLTAPAAIAIDNAAAFACGTATMFLQADVPELPPGLAAEVCPELLPDFRAEIASVTYDGGALAPGPVHARATGKFLGTLHALADAGK